MRARKSGRLSRWDEVFVLYCFDKDEDMILSDHDFAPDSQEELQGVTARPITPRDFLVRLISESRTEV